MVKSIRITVFKWDKYNVRNKDYKQPWWMSINNRILEDSDVFGLNDGEFRAWIYILSQCSLKRNGTVDIDLEHAHRVCKVDIKHIKSLIEKFSIKSILSESGQDLASIRPASGHHTTEQNNTIQNNTEQTTSCTSVELSTKVPTGKISPREHVVFKTKEELISAFDEDTAHLWKSLYPDENYLRREFLKAWDYYVRTNPQKTPRTLSGWKRALGSWLERAWPHHMRTIQSQPKKPRAIEDILQEQGLEHVG